MLPLVIAGVAVGSLLVASKVARAKTGTGMMIEDDRPDERPDFEPAANDDGEHIDTRVLAQMVGAPAIWQDVFALIAYGESKGNDDVGLGQIEGAPVWARMNISANDAAAAARSYDRNESWLRPCWQPETYSFGSAGRFQMFPANGLAAFKGDAIYRCVHPWSLFSPGPSMIFAAWMARRLTQWPNYKGTVLSLRAGWASPTTMDKPTQAKREKWMGHCQSVGLPPSFIDKKLPSWKPAPARDLWDELGIGDGWLPESMQVAA